MAKDFKSYDVFISSPSDVMAERDTVQEAIEQINQISGAKEGFRLNPIRWEKDVSSQIGSSPQDIINEEVGDEYDIFVGILCNRFGQQTENYDSGTEEEFSRAYERREDKENSPEILFYFKDPRKSETIIDAEQLLKVANFKKKLGGLGVYGEFDTHDSLKTMVVAALIKAIERLKSRVTVNEKRGDAEKPLKPNTDSALIEVSEFDEDIGLMELSEIVLDAFENSTDTMETITTATKKLGDKIENRTAELRKIDLTGEFRQDNKATKPIIEKVAAEMQRYSHILDQATPDLKREFSSALRGMQHAVIISRQDGISSTDDVNELVDQLENMKSTLDDVHVQIAKFQRAISATPRMTSKLNQAKRRTLKSISEVLDFLSESSVNIDTTLSAIKQ